MGLFEGEYEYGGHFADQHVKVIRQKTKTCGRGVPILKLPSFHLGNNTISTII